MVRENSVVGTVLLYLPQEEPSSAALPAASSQVTQLYQPTNATVFWKDSWGGGRWTQPRSQLFSWKASLPHTHTPNPAKEVPFENQGHLSPLPAAQRRALPLTSSLCCYHLSSGLCRLKEAILPQCAPVSHGRESLTLQQHCTLKSADYPGIS